MKKTRGQDILLLLLFLLLVVFVSYVFMNKEHSMAKKTQPDYTDKTKCHGKKGTVASEYPCSFNDVPNYYDPKTCLIVVAPPSKDGKGDDKHYFRCATRKDLTNISEMPKPKDRDMNVCYIVPGCRSSNGNSRVDDIKAFKDDPRPQQCFSCMPQ